MLLILLQLLLFMVLLVVDGEPFRLALRRLPMFSNLDAIEICILDVFIAGLVLYTVASLPFGLFSIPVVFAYTTGAFIVSVYFHRNDLRKIFNLSILKNAISRNRRIFSVYGIVFALFLFVLVLQLYSLSGFVLGGIFDESIHALKVHLILLNNGVPMTMQPFLPEGIIYPVASHVIFAYGSQVLGFDPASSVYYITILFKSLPVFGAYFLGRKLSPGYGSFYPLGMSFIFAFVSSWPLYVTWGSNAFLVGFPLFLLDLGLLYAIIRSEGKVKIAELAVVGLLFGFAGAIMVSFIEVLFVMGLIFLVYYGWQLRKLFGRRARELSVIFLVCLLPMASMLFRFAYFFGYPGHNVGIPSDFTGYQSTVMPFTMVEAVAWAVEYLSPFVFIRVWVLILVGVLLLLLWKVKSNSDQTWLFLYSGSVFAAAALLSFLAFFLPSGLGIISWGHQGIIIAASISMFLMQFYVVIVRLLRKIDISRFLRVSGKSAFSSLMVVAIVFALINAPFIYYRIGVDPQTLSGSYSMFAVAGPADVQLMNWMKQNLSSSAVVLVSPYEPGLFIPAISDQRIVFPYTASAFTRSYETLVELLNDNVMNQTTLDLMENLSISHVYVGSNAAYWWFQKQKWNQLLFLGNPNFALVKNFGNAYLFKFNLTSSNVVFADNFIHDQWDEEGWIAYSYGSGSQNVTEVAGMGLRITSQAVATAGDIESVSCVSRSVFVQNNSDVTLSGSFQLASGFSGEDTYALVVSNVFQTQTFVIETNGGVMRNYKHSVELNASQTSFSVDISRLWYQSYEEPLPSNFLLQLVNYDFDGVQNVVYVHNVTVSAVPSSTS